MHDKETNCLMCANGSVVCYRHSAEAVKCQFLTGGASYLSKLSFPSETFSQFQLAHLCNEYNSKSLFDTFCFYMVSRHTRKIEYKNKNQTPVFSEILTTAYCILRCSELRMATYGCFNLSRLSSFIY